MRVPLPAWMVVIAVLIGLVADVGVADAQAAPTVDRVESRPARPVGDGPVVVRVRVDLHEINAIDDESETVAFVADLVLSWRDPARAFDPDAAGVDELVYQGSYQVDELAAGWFPQLVLVNGSSEFDVRGVVLRVRPDGSCRLARSVSGTAEVEFDLLRFPFDAQRFELVLQVLGFGDDEVRLESDVERTALPDLDEHVPQWAITRVEQAIRSRPVVGGDPEATASALVVSIDAERRSFHVRRLVVLPLFVIVLLSFSVFWMDRSSLGDRMNVSFIGVLAVVAYQTVVNDTLPHIASFTLMHGFLATSFLTTALTVPVSLAVSRADRRGDGARGDRIDRGCRWLFPIGYLGVILAMVGIVFAV